MKAVGKKTHENNSTTEYWLIKLETNPDVKISREHSKYEWVDENILRSKNFKFMPDVFHYIQMYFNGDL
jgi:hypothetical protein